MAVQENKEPYKGTDFYCDMVLSGKVEVDKVFETDSVLAFHHTRPSYPVHIVVVPKTHIFDLLEVNPNQMGDILSALQEVSRGVIEEYGSCRVVTNLGDYQDSKHLHFHISYGDKLPPENQGV